MKWFHCAGCAHMYTYIHILRMNEGMNEVKESEWKGDFWGEHSSWLEINCLVETSISSNSFLS